MVLNINQQRILIPAENNFLYNKKAQVISDKVYLGVNAALEDWVEISQEEKENIEKEWEERFNVLFE